MKENEFEKVVEDYKKLKDFSVPEDILRKFDFKIAKKIQEAHSPKAAFLGIGARAVTLLCIFATLLVIHLINEDKQRTLAKALEHENRVASAGLQVDVDPATIPGRKMKVIPVESVVEKIQLETPTAQANPEIIITALLTRLSDEELLDTLMEIEGPEILLEIDEETYYNELEHMDLLALAL